MTDIRKIRDALRAGLDGVTPGPWKAQSVDEEGPERGAVFIVGAEQQGLVGAALPWPTEVESGDFSRIEANGKHIERCSPENIRAILDELDRLERLAATGGP